jgi:hypothetical protein
MTSCHHNSGDCSAQPDFEADIAISEAGEVADATVFPVAASSKLTFTEELPMS